MNATELPDIVGQIKSAIAKEIHLNQPMSNYASRIGHPCMRFLVHSRRDWDKIAPISVEKKMLFDLGYVFERHVAKVYLEKAGYEIVEMDRAVQSEASGILKKYKIHGRIDFLCRDPKTKFTFPVEVKSAAPSTWGAVDSIEDMLFAKHYWVQQYPGQLMMYLLGKEYEVGLFLLINKISAEPKAIWLHQDYTYAEELLKKAEKVNEHMDAGTYPERIAYDDNICGRCDFASVCLTDVVRNEASILTDPELINELEERESLKEAVARYKELDDYVKKSKLVGIEKGIAGDFLIMGKNVHRKAYAVEENDYWQTSIKKIENVR